jgi:hypothetical protein
MKTIVDLAVNMHYRNRKNKRNNRSKRNNKKSPEGVFLCVFVFF